MTLEQLEQRVTALEEAFEELKRGRVTEDQKLAAPETGETASPDEDLVPEVEYPLVLSPTPPRQVIRLRGKVRRVRRGREDFGLSTAEWEALKKS